MPKYPSQLQDKFNLRFPDGMRKAIAERAKRNRRSMNTEIIMILEEALRSDNTNTYTEYTGEVIITDPRVTGQPAPANASEDFLKMMLDKLTNIEKKIDKKVSHEDDN
ncbi:Arc family DNA-binding protein [Candidatus Symbiopectobacterium sp. NZEC127]|uniref:Arc family DNA-binding protein n=1 Tax=Candidatus Symbiopectobacterium sp. NZEC127 TaxID=2820472 RepID=UPI002226E653|nr:Arc family DNA-binding protein [Candidatus Symbiopectobacterium sp. NZEC127]MCW2484858.1 Arc family DNA-binding protein [Candidatus Symbiopectobacterium sp. NZEC127]